MTSAVIAIAALALGAFILRQLVRWQVGKAIERDNEAD